MRTGHKIISWSEFKEHTIDLLAVSLGVPNLRKPFLGGEFTRARKSKAGTEQGHLNLRKPLVRVALARGTARTYN